MVDGDPWSGEPSHEKRSVIERWRKDHLQVHAADDLEPQRIKTQSIRVE
jgi:hypothetical protein